MNSRVLVLGGTSRLGSHFLWHLPQDWSAETAGRSERKSLRSRGVAHIPCELSDENAVRALLRRSKADAIVNFAARTDVDGCERERPSPDERTAPVPVPPGSAWNINAELPRWLAEEGRAGGRFLVQVSTDFVFDGERGPYPEGSPPSPLSPKVSWYGYTKGVGEAAVFSSKGPRAILRLSYPFGSDVPGRSDFALDLLARQRANQMFPLYTDQQITPTWIPDVSEALGAILARSSPRLYHIASPEVTTPCEFALALFRAAGLPSNGLPTTLLRISNPAPGRAPRPLHGGLLLGEVQKLNLRPRSFREGIRSLLERPPEATRPSSPGL